MNAVLYNWHVWVNQAGQLDVSSHARTRRVQLSAVSQDSNYAHHRGPLSQTWRASICVEGHGSSIITALRWHKWRGTTLVSYDPTLCARIEPPAANLPTVRVRGALGHTADTGLAELLQLPNAHNLFILPQPEWASCATWNIEGL